MHACACVYFPVYADVHVHVDACMWSGVCSVWRGGGVWVGGGWWLQGGKIFLGIIINITK